MTVLTGRGDEAQGRRIVCFCRRSSRPQLVQLTGGHRGSRMVVEGLPARAIIEKEYKVIG